MKVILYQLKYLLMVFIARNNNSLLLDNPTVNLPNLNSLLFYSIDDTVFACCRVPTSCSKIAWSMTGFRAAKEFFLQCCRSNL